MSYESLEEKIKKLDRARAQKLIDESPYRDVHIITMPDSEQIYNDYRRQMDIYAQNYLMGKYDMDNPYIANMIKYAKKPPVHFISKCNQIVGAIFADYFCMMDMAFLKTDACREIVKEGTTDIFHLAVSVKLDDYYIKNNRFIITAEPGFWMIPSMKDWLYSEIKDMYLTGEFIIDEKRFVSFR